MWFLSYSFPVWITLQYAIILSQIVLFLFCQIHKINGKLKVLNQLYNLLSSTFWWKTLQATFPPSFSPVFTIYLGFISVQEIPVNHFLSNAAYLTEFQAGSFVFCFEVFVTWIKSKSLSCVLIQCLRCFVSICGKGKWIHLLLILQSLRWEKSYCP